MKKFITTIITLSLVAVVGFGVNELIFAQAGPTNEGLLVSSNTRTSGTASAEREILSLLLELRSLNLNSDLFQSNVFRSFKDFGVVLQPQPVGRSNPFAPIGVDADDFSDSEDLTDLDDLSGLDGLDDFEL